MVVESMQGALLSFFSAFNPDETNGAHLYSAVVLSWTQILNGLGGWHLRRLCQGDGASVRATRGHGYRDLQLGAVDQAVRCDLDCCR